MNREWPDFLVAYNAVAVPAPLTSDREHDETVEATTATFFKDIRSALGLGELSYHDFFDQETKVISAPEQAANGETLRDSMEVFKRRGGQVIASVLHMSEAPGSLTTRFRRHTLTDKTYQAILDFQLLERIHHDLE